MTDIRLETVGARGRFGLTFDDTGDVRSDDTRAYAVLSGVIYRQGQWWADASLGSRLYTLRSITVETPVLARSLVLGALDPLVQGGQIQDLAVSTSVTANAPNELQIDLAWTAGGEQQQRSVRI